MTYETLKRLAANPQYKMSSIQIAELKQYQALERAQQTVRHPHDVPTHPTGFHEHPTDMPSGGRDGAR